MLFHVGGGDINFSLSPVRERSFDVDAKLRLPPTLFDPSEIFRYRNAQLRRSISKQVKYVTRKQSKEEIIQK